MALPNRPRMPVSVRNATMLLGIATSVRPLIGPNSAGVEVSSRCNYSCLMCPYHSPLTEKPSSFRGDYMDMALAERVFRNLGRLKVTMVNFGHRGEPMMHPDFAGIIRLASKEGLPTRVFTNGSMLDQKRMGELIDAGLTTLAVSLVGPTPESYVSIHPGATAETFHRLLDSLVLLQRLKREAGSSTPKLDLRFIAAQGNHSEVEEMVKLGIGLGADSINLFPFRYRAIGDVGSLAPNHEEEKIAVDRLRQLAPVAAKAGMETNPDEIAVYHEFGPASIMFPCYAAWYEINVEVDGNVTFCVRSRTSVGNVNERSLEDIWWSAKYNSLRKLALDPSKRPLVGECDCDRCCLFYANWRITRRLSTFGMAPRVETIRDR